MYVLVFRWNHIFGNNSLTAPFEEINFKPTTSKQTERDKKETEPRRACTKTNRQPLACIRGDDGYMEAYFGHLQKLKQICPNACIFKSLRKLDPEETDTAPSPMSGDELFDSGDLTLQRIFEHLNFCETQFLF